MLRVKVILVWLLPTLGLAASGQYDLEEVSGSRTDCFFIALSAAGQGKHARLPDVRSFDQSARVQIRRTSPQAGLGGFPAPVRCAEGQHLGLGPVHLSSTSSESALGLAKCWQFQWRTALEPRAPSLVS